MNCIKANTIGEAHDRAIAMVLKYGEDVVTEDGETTCELDSPLHVEICKPFNIPFFSVACPYSENFLEGYVEQFMCPTNVGDFAYTYGNRIFQHAVAGNQYKRAYAKLLVEETSRRAIIHIWDSNADPISHNPPCMQTIQFMIRDNKLNCVVHFRSHDILMAWGCNAYALKTLLTNMWLDLSKHYTKLEEGTLTIISTNPHIYTTRDGNVVDKFLQKVPIR